MICLTWKSPKNRDFSACSAFEPRPDGKLWGSPDAKFLTQELASSVVGTWRPSFPDTPPFPYNWQTAALNPHPLARMPKLRSLPSLVRTLDTSTTPLPSKTKDQIYTTLAYAAWRAHVIARASGRCEAMDHGHRCSKATPDHRMYADHIVELRDGGSLLHLNNGQCLCASHHTMKTMAARYRRHSARADGG
jgi:5-methylcytosine-specific restriction enzyme A